MESVFKDEGLGVFLSVSVCWARERSGAWSWATQDKKQGRAEEETEEGMCLLQETGTTVRPNF